MKELTYRIAPPLRALIESHPGIKAYLRKNGKEASRRFWNLLRVSIMRLKPMEIADFLKRDDLKLADVGTDEKKLGQDLADQFFNSDDPMELRDSQKALLFACLEMDAAWRMVNSLSDNEATSNPDRFSSLKELRNKLDIWRV